jgi:4-hydroxy-3-polyprenylbenzoate decarboxylase
MGYNSLAACIADLEKHKHLVRIKQEVDPVMEMAAIHLRVFEAGGPAILFERVKGSQFPAVSNLFGTTEQVYFQRYLHKDTTTDTAKKQADGRLKAPNRNPGYCKPCLVRITKKAKS